MLEPERGAASRSQRSRPETGVSRVPARVPSPGTPVCRSGQSTITCATWIPRGPSSRAMDCASARSPNFPTARHAKLAEPRREAVAPVSRIVPRPRSSMSGKTRLAAKKAPVQLTRRHRSNSSGVGRGRCLSGTRRRCRRTLRERPAPLSHARRRRQSMRRRRRQRGARGRVGRGR